MPFYDVDWARSGVVRIEAGSGAEAKQIFEDDQEAYMSESDTSTIIIPTEVDE